jgi:gliding motility-associated-like protein
MLVNGTDPTHVATTSWDFGDQNIFTSATNPVPHRFILPGSYDVTLTITTNGLKECTTSLTQKNLIVAKQVPVADFNFFPAKPTIVDTRVSFFNQSKYADAYTWFVDDVERSSDEDFSNYFPDNADATYMVKLLAETDGPVVCSDSITYPVHVSGEMFVHVPNTFTPNEDGLNDVFIPVIDGNDYEQYTFEIYTRSGELIFVSNDPEKSWDGKHKGTKVSSDLYIWKLAVKSKYLTEKTGYMGQIKLVR